MKNIDAKNHVRGESIYLDDIPEIKGTLYAQVYDAPVAHAKIISIDFSKAFRVSENKLALRYNRAFFTGTKKVFVAYNFNFSRN